MMDMEFATAMRRALESSRAADPAAATALIQEALGARPRSGTVAPAPASGSAQRSAQKTALPGRYRLTGLSGLSGLANMSRPGRGTLDGRGRMPPVPHGGRYETRAYGGRTSRVFVPSCSEDARRGLVVMLHGCTQTPDDFALGTTMNLAAEKAGFVIAYPAQTASENIQSCWNWFRPEDQRRDGGEPAVLAQIAREGSSEFAIPADRIFAAGLSAGGAMAAILARTHPDLFTAVGVHSGLPAGAARDLPTAFAAMRQGAVAQDPEISIPMIVFHGTGDATVSPVNGERLVTGDGILTEECGNGRRWSRLVTTSGSELWLVEGGQHAWFGGDPAGSYADPLGPDAAAETLRFFSEVLERP